MIRFVIVNKDTNERLAWFTNKQKALKYMRKYECECVDQDKPYIPKLALITETIS